MPTPLTPPSRCPWPGTDPLYVAYHDQEWGVPVRDPKALWGKLILDGFQAGLSWITILRKREAFLRAFDGLDPTKVARFRPARVEKLMADAGIVRNRAKIEGAVRSAQAYLEIEKRQPFDEFLWAFVGGRTLQNHWERRQDVPVDSLESRAMSKALKAQGFTFCGPTICYAFMQAVGMVDDHLVGCFRHGRAARMHRGR